RRARIADDEDQLAFDGIAAGPLQVLRSRDRLAVLVGAEERAIERVAREIVVIGIAAELLRRGLRCPDDADVAILAILVQLVLAAAIERDHLAARGLGIGTAGLLD